MVNKLYGVAFEVVCDIEPSPKGKMPWVELSGETISDSAFCIKAINAAFGVNLDANLARQDKAVSAAFRRAFEEGTRVVRHHCIPITHWNTHTVAQRATGRCYTSGTR